MSKKIQTFGTNIPQAELNGLAFDVSRGQRSINKLKEDKRGVFDRLSQHNSNIAEIINPILADLRRKIFAAYDRKIRQLRTYEVNDATSDALERVDKALEAGCAGMTEGRRKQAAVTLVACETAMAFKEPIPNQDRGRG